MSHAAFSSFLVGLLVVPPIVLVSRRWRLVRLLPSLIFTASLAMGAVIAGFSFWKGHAVGLDISQVAPFPFVLNVDRLSAFFLLLICAVGAPVALFSVSYVESHYRGARRDLLWALLPLFVLSMIVVVTASTAFAFLFGWELMTLFSSGLILIDGDSEQRRHNTLIYLLMMHAGTAAVVASFFLFLPHAARLDFASMRGVGGQMSLGLRSAIFLLAFIGFGTKAGIIPLHLWLPRAHPMAPSPVSALMSGVMLKTAVYGFVRFGFDFLGGGPMWWGYLVLAAGAVSGVLGVLYAIAEDDLKRLLAYHSIENIGIIYLGLGAALVFLAHSAPIWAAVALTAALLHSLNHALFKSLLFLGAGAISDATHTVDIEELGGLLRRMPVTGTAFLVACCSIIGLPLFNGFISEWLTFRSFLAGANLVNTSAAVILPLMIGVLALIGGLASACFAKVYGVAFLGRPRSSEAEHAREVALPMRVAMAILAAACVAIGIVPILLLRPLSYAIQQFVPGSALPEEAISISRIMPWIAGAAVAVAIAIAALRRATRLTPTWACGLDELSPRMQYTATSFSKPLRTVFATVYRPARKIEVIPPDQPYFPTAVSYRSVRTTSFERLLYRPMVDAVVSAARQVRRLHTGNIQTYLMYMFFALVLLLLVLRFIA